MKKIVSWPLICVTVMLFYQQSACHAQDTSEEELRKNGRSVDSLFQRDREEKAPRSGIRNEAENSAGKSSPKEAMKPAAELAMTLLFGNKKVQAEIQLSRLQLDDLLNIQTEMQREFRPLVAEMRELAVARVSDGPDEDQLQQVSDQLTLLQEELLIRKARYYQRMGDVLLPNQMKWLNQAVTQLRAIRGSSNKQVLMSEHLVQKLGIGEEQLKKMQAIAGASQRELDEIIAMQRLKTHQELLKVLSQKQRDEFEEIFGKEIDF